MFNEGVASRTVSGKLSPVPHFLLCTPPFYTRVARLEWAVILISLEWPVPHHVLCSCSSKNTTCAQNAR